MKDYDRILFFLIFYAVLSFLIVQYISRPFIPDFPRKETLNISDKVLYSNFNFSFEPGYATTYYDFYFAMYSPYVKITRNISLDNVTWQSLFITPFNITSCTPSLDIAKFTRFQISIAQPFAVNVTMHLLTCAPLQTLPPNVSKPIAKNSLAVCIIGKPVLTGNDKVLRLILWITIFTTLITVTDFVDKKAKFFEK